MRGAAARGQHRLARVAHRLLGVTVLDQPEVRRDAAPPAESGAAATGRRRGSCRSASRRAGPAPRANSARALRPRLRHRRSTPSRSQFRVERRVVQRHPAAERALQPQRHLRRRRLGEGEALDARGIGPGQHQAQQPVGQQLGLARARRGGDERGDGGIGRLQPARSLARSRAKPLMVRLPRPPTPRPARAGRSRKSAARAPGCGCAR